MRAVPNVRWIALCVGLTSSLGCVEPTVVACSDGRLCPGGSVCTPNGCSLPGVCGDGTIDDGEACDDGNRLDGDACSTTCELIICNNGRLDPGEQCDDGNALSHDGCSSGCKLELPTWHALVNAGLPRPLGDAAAAWMPDRGRAIVFGGHDGTSARSEAWWWTGAGWSPGPAGPPALAGSAMAWDGLGSVVLFGGAAGDPVPFLGATSECWVLGTSWTACAGPRAPARIYPAMATGWVPGEVVLYGGVGSGDLLSTWRGTATGWTDAGVTGPTSANMPTMAYDPVEAEDILVGVTIGNPPTWHLDASGWRSTADHWQARDRGSLTYDADRAELVSFGGIDEFVGYHNDTVALTATGWTEVSVSTRPAPRSGQVSFYDPLLHGTVISGGRNASLGTVRSDTWILRWESPTPDDLCDGTSDADGDGKVGCADPDCWGRCDPHCPPKVASCAIDRARCGDGRCNTDLESPSTCPEDCP